MVASNERKPIDNQKYFKPMQIAKINLIHTLLAVCFSAVLQCPRCYAEDKTEEKLPSIIVEQFDDSPAGSYSKERIEKKWKSVEWSYMKRANIVSKTDFEKKLNGKALRVSYPKGKVSSKESGASFVSELAPSNVYFLDYYVRFGHGNGDHWQFSKGGKLPGLGGGTCSSGGDRAKGDGWSCRYMWREKGKLILYLYHMNQKTKYGDVIDLKTKLIPGKWHRLTQRVEVNTDNKANGKIKIWVDGNVKLNLKNIRLRKDDLAPVDHFLFETFYGGSNKKWAPSIETLAYFDNIQIQRVPFSDLEVSQ